MPPEVVWTATGAQRTTREELAAFRDDLLASVSQLPFGEPLSIAQRDQFDRAVTDVYARRAGLFPAEAAHAEVWSYHALILAPDLALWRWRHTSEPNIERFIGSDLTRHSFGRLWWRAYTFTGGDWDDRAGWDLLSGLGEADIDQLQSRRSAYGVDPPTVRALAEIYLESRERAAVVGLESRLVWRDLLKRLLRRGAFVTFGALEPELLKAAARDQMEQAIEALGAPPQGSPDALQESVGRETWSSFDDFPLSRMIIVVTEAVDHAGVLTDTELVVAVEARLGVSIPGRFRPLVTGFAYMAQAKDFLIRDDDSQRWRLGAVPPAPDGRWGGGTPAAIREAARANGGVDDDLIGAVFTGRAGKTVRRVVRACHE